MGPSLSCSRIKQQNPVSMRCLKCPSLTLCLHKKQTNWWLCGKVIFHIDYWWVSADYLSWKWISMLWALCFIFLNDVTILRHLLLWRSIWFKNLKFTLMFWLTIWLTIGYIYMNLVLHSSLFCILYIHKYMNKYIIHNNIYIYIY